MPRDSEAAKLRVKTTKDRYGDQIFHDYGAVGGRKKVLKGMAKLKVTDPERFKQIYLDRSKKHGI